MQIASIALVLAASLSSCGESQQALDKQKEGETGGEQGNGGGDALPPPPGPTPPPPGPTPPPPPPGDDDDDHDGSDPGSTYGVTEILATQDDLVKRFNRRPPAEGATVEKLKAWTGPGWVYGRLTYKVTAADGTVKEEAMFNKCHAHGTSIGCHRSNEAGPGEPSDGASGGDDHDHDDGDDHDHGDDGDLPPIDDDDLPPIDDELPPIEEL